MSRPLRIEYEDAIYHVMNRGRARQKIYHGEAYYLAFLQCLSEAHQRFGLEILSYCLMGNHYHLLVKTPRGNISRAMRHINGVYTQRYNRLKRTDGALFRGRYKAILIDASSYLLEVSRYIHRNPAETRTPLVNKLENYCWSSYPAYVNKTKGPDWLSREEIYGELGSHKRYSGYRRYVELGTDTETRKFYERKAMPAIRGDKYFAEVAFAHARSWSKEINKSGIVTPIEISRIVEQVADYYGVDEKSVYVAKKGRGTKNIARWIAMKLSQDYSGRTLIEIGKVFGVGNYCTVSQTISRLVRLMDKDNRVAGDYFTISKDLTP